MSGRFKKILSIFFVAILVALALFGLFSCKKKKTNSSTETYAVEFSTSFLPYTAVPPDTQKVKAGEPVLAPVLDVVPSAGYALVWTTNASTRAAYDFSTPVTKDLVLYAVEVPRRYTITYLWDPERNLSVGSNPTSFTKETPTITLVAPKFDKDKDFGFEFKGWAYADDPDSVVTEIPQGTEGDVILRAKIKPHVYKVYYQEGYDNPNATSYEYGTVMNLQTPTREGYEFLGFTIYMDDDSTSVTALTPEFVKAHIKALTYGNATDLGLEAQWRKKE